MGRIADAVAFADVGATISTSAVTLESLITAANLDLVNRVWLTVTGADVRYRYTGTAPTAAIGHILTAGGAVQLVNNENVKRLQFIRAGAVDAVIFITLEE